MANGRADKGGQYGKNGEWYEGGQYLPSSPETVKGQFGKGTQQNESKPRKQEIAPYKWETSEKQSLWKKCGVGTYCKFNQTGYSKETGAQGYIEIFESNFWNNSPEDIKNEIKENITRWNNGERWI